MMALDHMHCDSFEEHKSHTWLLEYTKRGKPNAYYVECDGVRRSDAEFLAWAEETLDEKLLDWQKILLLKNIPLQLDIRRKDG